jgi:hypothetical protein
VAVPPSVKLEGVSGNQKNMQQTFTWEELGKPTAPGDDNDLKSSFPVSARGLPSTNGKQADSLTLCFVSE